ncbi:diguanylate cyclase (GGDEF) domain-containing protein [Pseudobutyrivibrio sp. 49]|nr:diguanylate cyclase (GGDEF) domain-containing protein [Pseudobutyrivibrio sp. 49]
MSKVYRAVTRHKNKNEDIREYFSICMEAINEGNLYMLRRACMYISIIYLIMIGIALVFVPDFKISWVHVLMLPLMVVQYRVNLYIMRHGPISTKATGIVCCSFYFWLSMIFILIDTYVYSDKQAYFVPMLILVYPTLYIDRMYKYGWEEMVAAITFAAFSYNYKEFALFRRDVYMVLGAYSVSMVLGHLVLEVRSREALAMKELKGESSLDKLTHVFNKDALLSKIDSYFLQKAEDDYCAMMVLDLDDFKSVNDNLGHNTGDILLENVGRLLLDSFRAYDITGRYGGDEFVVMMPQMSDVAILQSRCRTLQKLLAEINLGNSEPFTMSMGAIISNSVRDTNELFMMADDALYKSKIGGKNNCTIWSVEQRNYELPILLSINDGRVEAIKKLKEFKGEEFEILSAASDSDALCVISQYHKQLKLVLLEVNEENEFGVLTMKYMKQRESFNRIPILAVVKSQEGERIAKEWGADKVVMYTSTDEEFGDAINTLVSM